MYSFYISLNFCCALWCHSLFLFSVSRWKGGFLWMFWSLCHGNSCVLKLWQLQVFSWPWSSRSLAQPVCWQYSCTLPWRSPHGEVVSPQMRPSMEAKQRKLCLISAGSVQEFCAVCSVLLRQGALREYAAEGRQHWAGSVGPSAQLGPLGKKRKRKERWRWTGVGKEFASWGQEWRQGGTQCHREGSSFPNESPQLKCSRVISINGSGGSF